MLNQQNKNRERIYDNNEYPENVVFVVRGIIEDYDAKAELVVETEFGSEESAKKAFEVLSKKHPKSELIVEKLTKKQLSTFA